MSAPLRCRYRGSYMSALLVADIYLRNLLTHTVNNLQQTLNYVKLIQISVINQNFNIIHIMCENFRTIPLVLCNI